MAIVVKCGSCETTFRARDEFAGKQAKCPHCGKPLLLDGERVPNHDVFISYSHKDKAVADAVCVALEAKRVRCWIAPRDIPPGAAWGGTIIDALQDARVMVLVYSGQANLSPQVVREVERAVAKGVVIAPFRIEDAPMSKQMEYFLSASHWFDAMTGDVEANLERFVPMIRVLLWSQNQDERGEPVAKPAAASGGAPARRKRRLYVFLSVLACVVILAAVLGLLLHGPSRWFPDKPNASTAPGTAVASHPAGPPQATPLPTSLVSARAEAAVAWDRAKGLDRGQTLGAALDAADVAYRTAVGFDEAKRYPEAMNAYGDFQKKCQSIAAMDSQRRGAAACRKEAEASRVSASSIDADIAAKAMWMSAEKLMEKAAGDFETGQFDSAMKTWGDARKTYDLAIQEVTAIKKAQGLGKAYAQRLSESDATNIEKHLSAEWREISAAASAADKALAAAKWPTAAAKYQEATDLLAAAGRRLAELTEAQAKGSAFRLGRWARKAYDACLIHNSSPQADLGAFRRECAALNISPLAYEEWTARRLAYGQMMLKKDTYEERTGRKFQFPAGFDDNPRYASSETYCALAASEVGKSRPGAAQAAVRLGFYWGVYNRGHWSDASGLYISAYSVLRLGDPPGITAEVVQQAAFPDEIAELATEVRRLDQDIRALYVEGRKKKPKILDSEENRAHEDALLESIKVSETYAKRKAAEARLDAILKMLEEPGQSVEYLVAPPTK